MSSLRKYIRLLLRESRFKQMNKPRFTGLKSVLAGSSFLDADPEGDLDEEAWSSEAAKVLRNTLRDYFDDNFGADRINTTVMVDYVPTDPAEGYNSVLKSATYYYDGRHNVEILLANIEDGTTFGEIGNAHQKVYEVIMHELLHMQQFLKFSRGNPTEEKWNKFKEEYESRGGASGMGGDYFFFDNPDGPSELETFSFQMANELVHNMGKLRAVKLLQQQHPDYNEIRKHSASFRNIETNSPGVLDRPELRDMVKRAKEYAKDISESIRVNEAGKKKKKKKRDHKAEYKKWGATPQAKKDRAARNRNRRIFEKEGKVKKGDGKEIDHKKPLSKGGSNSRSNLRVVDRKTNRKKGAK